MQVGIDVTSMHTNFGGHGFSGFGDIVTSKMAKFPFWTMDYKCMVIKIFNQLELAQKIYANRP